MRNYICTLVIILIGVFAEAQTANYTLPQSGSNYNLLSLYERDAFVTERFLPFVLRDSSGTPLKVENVIAFYPCFSMVDPHRESIFHLYCVEETDSKFSIVFWENDALKTVQGPFVNVKQVAIVSSTPKPKDPGVDPVFQQGKSLFLSKCATCHPSEPIAKGQTAASIENSFKSSPNTKMKSFIGFFSVAEREALAKYINQGL